MSELPTESPSRVGDLRAAYFERWRDGESAALDDLVRLLSPMLWQVVRASGLDRATAEDVVQTTWLDAGALRGVHHRAPRGGRVAVHDRAPRGLAGLQAVGPPAAGGGRGDRPAAARRARSRGAGRPRRRQRPAVGLPGPAARALPAAAAHRRGRGRGRTTRRSRPSSTCRSAASARPGAGAWTSSGVSSRRQGADDGAATETPSRSTRATLPCSRRSRGSGSRSTHRRSTWPTACSPAIAAEDLEFDLLTLVESDGALAGVRPRRSGGGRDETGAWSLEYVGPDLRVYVRLTRIEDRTRLDGWVVPARPLDRAACAPTDEDAALETASRRVRPLRARPVPPRALPG